MVRHSFSKFSLMVLMLFSIVLGAASIAHAETEAVIIYPKKYEDAANRLKDLHADMGVESVIRSTLQIFGAYNPIDGFARVSVPPEPAIGDISHDDVAALNKRWIEDGMQEVSITILSYVQDLHVVSRGLDDFLALKYVVLLGNDRDIPPSVLFDNKGIPAIPDFLTSDFFYGTKDYVDFLPEYTVGRIPVKYSVTAPTDTVEVGASIEAEKTVLFLNTGTSWPTTVVATDLYLNAEIAVTSGNATNNLYTIAAHTAEAGLVNINEMAILVNSFDTDVTPALTDAAAVVGPQKYIITVASDRFTVDELVGRAVVTNGGDQIYQIIANGKRTILTSGIPNFRQQTRVSGTCTGVTANSITDTDADFGASGVLQGDIVRITGGPGAGNMYVVNANAAATATTLALTGGDGSPADDGAEAVNSTYEVVHYGAVNIGINASGVAIWAPFSTAFSVFADEFIETNDGNIVLSGGAAMNMVLKERHWYNYTHLGNVDWFRNVTLVADTVNNKFGYARGETMAAALLNYTDTEDLALNKSVFNGIGVRKLFETNFDGADNATDDHLSVATARGMFGDQGAVANHTPTGITIWFDKGGFSTPAYGGIGTDPLVLAAGTLGVNTFRLSDNFIGNGNSDGTLADLRTNENGGSTTYNDFSTTLPIVFGGNTTGTGHSKYVIGGSLPSVGFGGELLYNSYSNGGAGGDLDADDDTMGGVMGVLGPGAGFLYVSLAIGASPLSNGYFNSSVISQESLDDIALQADYMEEHTFYQTLSYHHGTARLGDIFADDMQAYYAAHKERIDADIPTVGGAERTNYIMMGILGDPCLKLPPRPSTNWPNPEKLPPVMAVDTSGSGPSPDRLNQYGAPVFEVAERTVTATGTTITPSIDITADGVINSATGMGAFANVGVRMRLINQMDYENRGTWVQDGPRLTSPAGADDYNFAVFDDNDTGTNLDPGFYSLRVEVLEPQDHYATDGAGLHKGYRREARIFFEIVNKFSAQGKILLVDDSTADPRKFYPNLDADLKIEPSDPTPATNHFYEEMLNNYAYTNGVATGTTGGVFTGAATGTGEGVNGAPQWDVFAAIGDKIRIQDGTAGGTFAFWSNWMRVTSISADGLTINADVTGVNPDAVTSAQYQVRRAYTEGTVTHNDGDPATVTGVGTKWNTNKAVQAGDWISLNYQKDSPATNDTAWFKIASVVSDTQLILANFYPTADKPTIGAANACYYAIVPDDGSAKNPNPIYKVWHKHNYNLSNLKGEGYHGSISTTVLAAYVEDEATDFTGKAIIWNTPYDHQIFGFPRGTIATIAQQRLSSEFLSQGGKLFLSSAAVVGSAIQDFLGVDDVGDPANFGLVQEVANDPISSALGVVDIRVGTNTYQNGTYMEFDPKVSATTAMTLASGAGFDDVASSGSSMIRRFNSGTGMTTVHETSGLEAIEKAGNLHNGPDPVPFDAERSGVGRTRMMKNVLDWFNHPSETGTGVLVATPVSAQVIVRPSATTQDAALDENKQTFSAQGGTSPYTWTITTNNSGTGTASGTGASFGYVAGTATGIDVLQLSDSAGALIGIPINVIAAEAVLTIDPSNDDSLVLQPGATKIFTGAGGIPPYTFLFVDLATDNLSGATIGADAANQGTDPVLLNAGDNQLLYIAGATTEVTDKITLRDSFGQEVSVNIQVSATGEAGDTGDTDNDDTDPGDTGGGGGTGGGGTTGPVGSGSGPIAGPGASGGGCLIQLLK